MTELLGLKDSKDVRLVDRVSSREATIIEAFGRPRMSPYRADFGAGAFAAEFRRVSPWRCIVRTRICKTSWMT